jgi:histidyl-tRNA synthetase
MASRTQPARLFYVASVFRYDRPQAGRYRVHHQFGVEAIGDGDPYIDAEVIDLLRTFYESLGLSDLRLALNSIGDAVCRPAYIEKLRDYYRPHLNELCGDCRRRFEVNPLRMLDCKNAPCQPFKANAPRSIDNLCEPCSEHFASVRALLDALGQSYTLDPALVRGIDYYTRTAFEFLPSDDSGQQSTIGGGGRYDGLIEQLGGRPTPGFGFGTGIERIILNLKRQGLEPPAATTPAAFIAVTSPDLQAIGLTLARQVRSSGVNAIVGNGARSLKSQFGTADTLGTRFVIILGARDLAEGLVTIRDLQTGQERRLPIEKASGLVGAL